jgi:PleD family two-component response regulator
VERGSLNATTNDPEPPNGYSARVLIVDDDRDGAVSLGMLLKLRGYTVEVVTDSMQFVSCLESFRPDIIFLDIAMPNVSGYDIAQQVRMHSTFNSVAIVAISGYADEAHKARSLASGCNQHLAKPVDLSTVERTIAQELERRSCGQTRIAPLTGGAQPS